MHYKPRARDNVELAADLGRFGADDLIDEIDDDNDLFPVLRRNWLTIELFLQLQTQWRVGMGGITGFDYAAIEAACRMGGLKMNKTRFNNLQIMEGAVLKALSEKR